MKPTKIRTKGNNGWVYVVNEKRYHRADGPALNFDDGEWSWWMNNQLHRYYGKALSNRIEWHIHGRAFIK